jgi:hypothetical protein
MPEPAQILRSLSIIRTELEFLQASNVLSGPQYNSIMAQLPVWSLFFIPSLVRNPSVDFCSFEDSLTVRIMKEHNGMQAQYVDPKFATGEPMFNPSLVAQQAQDPNNAAHPKNPKVAPHTCGSFCHMYL